MGVRGLTLRLKKSAIEQAIGCADSACHLRTGVVVDGPSLAYWVHATLVDALTADGHFQVWPPFNLIKETLLGFLEELGKPTAR